MKYFSSDRDRARREALSIRADYPGCLGRCAGKGLCPLVPVHTFLADFTVPKRQKS